MSGNLNRLQQKLDQQKGLPTLNLNDFIIGDEGCKLLSDFLRENNHYTSLEIRGNNISSSGFAKICEGLKNNLRLSTIIAEWNQIGSNIKGVEALKNLIDENPAIQTIDLKNNGLKPESSAIISQILAQNPNISNLDLKWNEIGIKGGDYIIEAIQLNTKIKYLDLSCNKLPEEMTAEVNRILARNRSGHVIPQIQEKLQQQQRLNQFQPPEQGNTLGSQQQTKKLPRFQDQNRSLNTAALDQIAQMDKNKTRQIKEKLDQELEEERRVRETLEYNLKKLEEEVFKKTNIRADLEITLSNLASENQLYQMDLDRAKEELQALLADTTTTIADLQNRLTGNQRIISSLEREHMHEIDNIHADNEDFIKSLIRDWTIRYNVMDDRYRSVRTQKEELEDRVNMANENLLRFEIDHTDYDIRKRQAEDFRLLNDKLNYEIECKRATKRKNDDINKEMAFKDTQATDKINIIENELNDYRMQINELHKKLSQYNMKIEKLRCDNIKRDGDIDKLEEEVNELHRALIRLKDAQKEQIDHSSLQHNNQRRIYKESMEQQHFRICELEKAIRTQDAENARIKSDYERLCNSIQHNIGRTVMDSLKAHQEVLHGGIYGTY